MRRSRRSVLDWAIGSRAVNYVHHISEVLLVGDAVGGFGREVSFGAEVGGEVAEQFDAGDGVEFIAAQYRLHGQGGPGGGNALAEARGQVRLLAERIELARRQLDEVGLRDARVADDNGVRGGVPQIAGTWGSASR